MKKITHVFQHAITQSNLNFLSALKYENFKYVNDIDYNVPTYDENKSLQHKSSECLGFCIQRAWWIEISNNIVK